jgi:hypothetical protein
MKPKSSFKEDVSFNQAIFSSVLIFDDKYLNAAGVISLFVYVMGAFLTKKLKTLNLRNRFKLECEILER